MTKEKFIASKTVLTDSSPLTPQEIADLLEPAVMSCEFHDGEDNPTGKTDWKSWLIEQIEKYAQSKR